MWIENPRKPTVKKSHLATDIEARLATATTQEEALLRREPYLWDVRDVQDKLIGLVQLAEENRAAVTEDVEQAAEAARAAGKDPRYGSYEYLRVHNKEHVYRQQYDELFHRWFLAQPRATSRSGEHAGISEAEAWHRAALLAPKGAVLQEWHIGYADEQYRDRPLIEQWRDVMQPPLIRLEVNSVRTMKTGLPGELEYGWSGGNDIESAAKSVVNAAVRIVDVVSRGMEDCDAHGWSLSFTSDSGNYYSSSRRLALLVRLPDTRIAVFVTWARARSVGQSFNRWRRSGRMFTKLHFHKPDFYKAVHWESAPSLQTDIPLVAMLELDNAGIILPQSTLEQQLFNFSAERLFEEARAAIATATATEPRI